MADFDKVVKEALEQMRYWAANYWRYEYRVYEKDGEVICRLEKVR